MPIQEVLSMSKSDDVATRLRILLALHCAPILKGIKAANMLAVHVYEAEYICRMLGHTGIFCRILKTQGDRCILYVYRKQRLAAYLNRRENREFLEQYGYDTGDLYGMLAYLSSRIEMYANGNVEFPHEIGIFLEYPMQDVKGFVENKGENFAYSGYWKVYSNVGVAKKTFRAYDEKRELVVREVMRGKSMEEIAS